MLCTSAVNKELNWKRLIRLRAARWCFLPSDFFYEGLQGYP